MSEKVVCNKCGAEYTDQDSVEQARKWIADGYAPCPVLQCPGQLEIKGTSDAVLPTACTNCGYMLINVHASRSIELEQGPGGGKKWVEKNVFSSAVSCPNCHEVLSDEEVEELGIEGY